MNKRLVVALFFMLVSCFNGTSVARADDFILSFNKAFYSSDRQITVKFKIDVDPASGNEIIVNKDEKRVMGIKAKDFVKYRSCSVHIPVMVNNVNHYLHGPIGIIKSDQPLTKMKDMEIESPYILVNDFSEDEYRAIADKTMEVTYVVCERPYSKDITFGPMPTRPW